MHSTQGLAVGKSRVPKILTGTILVLASSVFALVLAEVALRIIPLPGVEFNVSTYDELTGSGLYPGSILMYRNDRGEATKRKISDIGYPDSDHAIEKKDGIKRIGFFGDSYTEARQVDLSATFFRQIERILGESKVETFSFGVSGYSTLQSYLTYTKWGQRFDLDLIVYVFVDNDPGDNIPELKLHAPIPYPVLSGSGFSIDDSFRSAVRKERGVVDKFGDYLTSRSLVLSTISERVRLLRSHGIKLEVTEEDRWMANKAVPETHDNRMLTSDDLPSTWPNDLREHATKVTEAVVTKWFSDVQNQEREFVIAYVPRAREMHKGSEQQDSWKYWLETFCSEHQISFLDSSPALLQAEAQGDEVFYDHFTEDGHKAFASSFAEWYRASFSRFAAEE